MEMEPLVVTSRTSSRKSSTTKPTRTRSTSRTKRKSVASKPEDVEADLLLAPNELPKKSTKPPANKKKLFGGKSSWKRLFFMSLLAYLYLFESNFFILFYAFCLCLLYTVFQTIRHSQATSPLKTSLTLLYSIVISSFVLHSAFRFMVEDHLDLMLTRLGRLTPTTAEIFIRYPPAAPVSGVSLKLFYRPLISSRGEAISRGADWMAGPVIDEIQSVSDWTGRVKLSNLTPETSYEFTWMQTTSDGRLKEVSLFPRLQTNNDSSSKISFKTPGRGRSSIRVAFGSCLKPYFPYGSEMPGVGLIAAHKPDLFLSLGDFIYADAGIHRVRTLQQFRRMYREVFAQQEMQQLMQSGTSIVGIIDDHEIKNNWYRSIVAEQLYDDALKAFDEYLGLTGDNQILEMGLCEIFLMDTRSFRDYKAKSMLGLEQKQKLFNWLMRLPKDSDKKLKIVATSVPFTFNFGNDDTWFGFVDERIEILDFIHQNSIEGVLFLSGDRHQVASVEFDYKQSNNNEIRNGTRLFEYSVSPINQFNPKIPFFAETTNTFNQTSDWLRDRTLYYSAFGGRFVFGRLDIFKDRCFQLCIFSLSSSSTNSSDDEACQGDGLVLFSHRHCFSNS